MIGPALQYIGKWAAVTIGIFGATLVLVKVFPPVNQEKTAIAAVIAAPVVHTKLADGTDLAVKQIIVSSVADLERIKSDSAEIILLQKTVKRLSKQGSAVIINTTTRFDTATKVIHDSAVCSFHQKINNKWINAAIVYDGHDTASLDLHVNNEYAVVFDTRKDTSFVTVHSINPYTTTTGIASFQIPKKKHLKGALWIGLVAGILFHLIIHH